MAGPWTGCLSKSSQNVGGPKNTLLLDVIRQHVNQFRSNRSRARGEDLLYNARTQCARARVCGRDCFNGPRLKYVINSNTPTGRRSKPLNAARDICIDSPPPRWLFDSFRRRERLPRGIACNSLSQCLRLLRHSSFSDTAY